MATEYHDNCVFSCRYRAAVRVPTWSPDLQTVRCGLSSALQKFCAPRNTSYTHPDPAASTSSSPLLVVSVTVLPARVHSLTHMLTSLRRGYRPPDHIIVSSPRLFERDALKAMNWHSTNLSNVVSAIDQSIDVVTCERDDGPGTKVLCALERARQYAKSASNAFLTLVDDDLAYQPWALQVLDQAIRSDLYSARHAYAFDVHSLTSTGRAVTAGLYPSLLVGAGHAMFAIRLSLLDGLPAFYSCLRSYEPRTIWHDDVWISMWLQDRLGVELYRIGGTPFEIASRSFPNSHGVTDSRRPAGALVASHSKPGQLAMDRESLDWAMARLRTRVLSDGLCGVRPNASVCVGSWCASSPRTEWGAHRSRMPWETQP